MIIKSSTTIRNNYNEISDLCREKGEPVYLTKNGEGDLVVLSIEAFENLKNKLELKSELLEAQAAHINGEKTFTLNEMRLIVIGE